MMMFINNEKLSLRICLAEYGTAYAVAPIIVTININKNNNKNDDYCDCFGLAWCLAP